jgi:hypothetical protein
VFNHRKSLSSSHFEIWFPHGVDCGLVGCITPENGSGMFHRNENHRWDYTAPQPRSPHDIILASIILILEPGSSASIVSGYGLNYQAIEVRSPAEVRDFSFNLYVQTSSEAHPASCPMGIGGPFPGVKRGRGVTLTTHPHLMPRPWKSRSYTFSPHCASIGLLWNCFYNSHPQIWTSAVG